LRSLYEMARPPEAQPPGSDRRVRLFLQLAIISFWAPCAAADVYLLWRGFGREAVCYFVFWLLFRQALVFLTLWFTVSIVHGLMVGRRTPREPRRKRKRRREEALRTAETAGVTLSRAHRGL
jgi:membrane protein implicated in regulation of membrane protease activity